MTIAEVHSKVEFLLDKERGEYFTSAEIDEALDISQMRKLSRYFGDDNLALSGNNRVTYKSQQYIDDAIKFFKANASLAVAAPFGNIVIPSDALYITSLETDAIGSRRGGTIPIVSESEYINRVNSAIFELEPVAKIIDNSTIKVWAPAALTTLLSYIKRPTAPSLSGGTDLLWDDANTMDIIYLTIQILGLNASDADAIQFGAEKSVPKS